MTGKLLLSRHIFFSIVKYLNKNVKKFTTITSILQIVTFGKTKKLT